MARRGRHPHNKLTEVVIRQALPGRHADGNGLYLFVRSTLSRHFVQRLVIQGKRYDIGLGPFPLRRLVDARLDALDNRRIARAGGDLRDPLIFSYEQIEQNPPFHIRKVGKVRTLN